MSNFDALEDQFLTTYVPLLELNRPGCTSGDPQGLPPLNRDSFINTWTPIMESEFSGLLIPNGDWAYGGMLYLPQSFKIVIKWKRRKIRQRSGAEWTWNDFKEAVVWALDLKTISSGVVQGLIVGPAVIVGAIGLLGFGSAGVASGSVAATIQSNVYRGATGGLFSVLQSVGARGAIGAAGTAAAGVAGGTLAAVSNVLSRRR